MNILSQFLKKLGVTSATELNPEELKTYKNFEDALTGRKLTDEDTTTFLQSELADAISKVTKQRLGSTDDTFLKMKIEFVSACMKFLATPQMEKQMAEHSIRQMLEG